jgi:hypothetical protein
MSLLEAKVYPKILIHHTISHLAIKSATQGAVKCKTEDQQSGHRY